MTKREQQAEQYRQQRIKAEAHLIARRIQFDEDMKRMKESGDLDRCAKLLSMAYQVFTQANIFAEEAVSLMEQYGVIHKKAKTAANNLMQSFDAFDKVMSDMIKNGGSSNPQSAFDQLCFDTEMLSIILYGFMDNNIEVKRGPYFQPKLFLPLKR
ncbi:MAG: hypothetical protein K6F85_05460 [Bacteroidales bacterium]|nr:hypothetical protein [Bacteroidales bacterium]